MLVHLYRMTRHPFDLYSVETLPAFLETETVEAPADVVPYLEKVNPKDRSVALRCRATGEVHVIHGYFRPPTYH